MIRVENQAINFHVFLQFLLLKLGQQHLLQLGAEDEGVLIDELELSETHQHFDVHQQICFLRTWLALSFPHVLQVPFKVAPRVFSFKV